MADKRIRLTEPGTSFDMLVSSVTPETVEKNDYYLFTNQVSLGGAEILVPQSSVKAQMERLGISSVEGMIGRWVRLGRSTKMSRANKPYWDIDWAAALHGAAAQKELAASGAENGSAGGDMGKPNAGTPSAAPSAESAKPKMRDAYKDLTKWVVREIMPLYETEGWEYTSETVASITATLFIQACKSGKVE